jgi:hypothetical protein
MASKHSKAKVATIVIGPEQFEGLMDGDGKFYVSASQIADLFQFDQSQASRTIKRLLGEGFQFDRIASDLNPKPVNAIPLSGFNLVIKRLARKGDPKAAVMDDALSENSLTEVFCDAFGIEAGKAERTQRLKDLMKSIECRDDLTEAIANYCARHPEMSEGERDHLFSNATDRLYKILVGVRARELRLIHGMEKGANVREWIRKSGQRKAVNLLSAMETSAAILIDSDQHPMEVIEAVASLYAGQLSDLMQPVAA